MQNGKPGLGMTLGPVDNSWNPAIIITVIIAIIIIVLVVVVAALAISKLLPDCGIDDDVTPEFIPYGNETFSLLTDALNVAYVHFSMKTLTTVSHRI